MTSEQAAKLSQVRHFALDMDGTIYAGGTLFEFTKPFLMQLESLGIGNTFLTNNSSKSARDYRAHLEKFGLKLQDNQLFTSGMATVDYLKSKHPEYHNLFILGTKSLQTELTESGFHITETTTSNEPDAVIVAFDLALDYDQLCKAGYYPQKTPGFAGGLAAFDSSIV